MNHILAKVRKERKKPFFKLISDCSLFEDIDVDHLQCVQYSVDHNLDEDTWFKIIKFKQTPFCIDILRCNFDSKDYDDLKKCQFNNISYLFSVQDENFYFQKITPSLFVRRKTLCFGEVAEMEENDNRLVVNPIPDAIYLSASDTLVFKKLATISSIFPKIDELYKEATNEEVSQFLCSQFIELDNGFDMYGVSKPNRKRISLAMDTLSGMKDGDKEDIVYYIYDYCNHILRFEEENSKFMISNDEELKHLLYGIEQRFYTTPFGGERRLANSIQKLD